MSFMSKVGDFLSGGLGSAIVGAVKDYYPPSMSDSEKAILNQQIQIAADNKEIELRKLANQQEEEFNSRIKEMEGTANDLKNIPLFGTLVLFLRGVQRPAWGFMTMYIDYKVFSNQWSGLTEQQESVVLVINLLVLGFLFGERAVKNVAPMLLKMKGKGSGLQSGL